MPTKLTCHLPPSLPSSPPLSLSLPPRLPLSLSLSLSLSPPSGSLSLSLSQKKLDLLSKIKCDSFALI